MKYELINPNIDPTLSLIEQIFINRKIPRENINHYLNTTDQDILNPELLKDISHGAKILIGHIKNNDDIFIQIDEDCDGFTSSALLVNYLYKLFPSFVDNHLYYRVHTNKQHGIIPKTVPNNIKLVIIPDAGSNQYEEHT